LTKYKAKLYNKSNIIGKIGGKNMPNILDYITWRGDLNIKQSEFNGVDNLILARFSYFPLDKLFFGDKKVTIRDAYSRAKSMGIQDSDYLQIDDKDLFPAIANSERFGKLYITNYINKIDREEEKQFSAVTIFLPDNTVYVGFRGTDNTLVGWKEDFNMSFSSNIPSQHDAVEYLEKVAKITKKKIRVGGHSKGGSLAVYAATFCNENVKKQIIDIYNNDGPGMSEKVIIKKEYREILNKIHTYIPQSSVIGRLLYHEEKYTVIQSVQKGLMQHDLFSWQIKGNNFICLDEVTNGSEIVNKVIKGWLDGVTPKQREEFIDILYQIFSSTDAQTLNELSTNWFKNAGILLKAYTTTDETNKEIISQTLSAILSITKNNLIESIPKPSIKKKETKKGQK